jgi:hypothetical protein
MAALALMGSARADDLSDARTAVDASDYEAARTSINKALGSGHATPEDLADLYRMKGIVEAAVGNAAAATTAFGRWLALDPKASLPQGTSPKITRPFAAAQEQAKSRSPVKAKADTTSDPPTVTLVVESDPFMMIATARVYVRADGRREQILDGQTKVAIELPKGKRLDLRVEALDDNGNRVLVIGSREVPIVITGAGSDVPVVAQPDKPRPVASETPEPRSRPEPIDDHPPHARPLYLQWWLWTSVAVAAGAGSTYFGLQARSGANKLNALNADSQDHKFDEALAVQSDAKRDVLLFNIGMGVTGAVAIGAAILYLTEPHAEPHTNVVAVPVSGGGAVVWGGDF